MILRASFSKVSRIAQLQRLAASPVSNGLYNGRPGQLLLASPFLWRPGTSRSLSSTRDLKHESPAQTHVASEGEDPVEMFNKHLNNGTLTKPLAAEYLKAADIANRIHAGLGEAAITWMWNEHDKYDWINDRKMLRSMIYLLVREGKEELIWDWIRQKTSKSADVRYKTRFSWRIDALKYLVTAKAFYSPDNSLDGSLESFFKAKESELPLPFLGAETECCKLLTMSAGQLDQKIVETELKAEIPKLAWPNTSPKLFDRFLKGLSSAGDKKERFQVSLPLFHPREPNAFPFLKYCRAKAKDPEYIKQLVTRDMVYAWLYRAKHAKALLRKQGHEKEAKWLAGFTAHLQSRSRDVVEKFRAKKQARHEGRNRASELYGEEFTDTVL